MSEGGELPGSAYGYLGPVEPAEGTEAPPPRGRVKLTRRQKYLATALLLALAAALVARQVALHPEQAANSPPPYPSQISHFGYVGPAHDAVKAGDAFTLRVLATDDGPGPYEIVDIHQSYRGITVAAGSPLPRTVTPGSPVEIDVVYRVTDCGSAPPDAGMPFLDVTLRNTRAIQTVSQIFGDHYARDLSRNLHTACPASGNRAGLSVASPSDAGVR